MSKTTGILGAAAITSISATVLPVALLSGSLTKEYIPNLSSATEIKEKYKEIECLNNYFGTIEFSNNKTHKLLSSHINNFSNNSKSCLLVEYRKRIYSNNKWQGEFRLIWAVKDESHGFITVTNAKTKEDGWLWGNSAAYTLTKDSSWKNPHMQEIVESKKNNVGLSNLIPQATSSLPKNPDKEKYWGFDPDINNICKKGSCMEDEIEKIHKSYSWEFIGSNGNDTIHSWNANINLWTEKIFNWKELVNKINDVKGKWQEKPNW